jgi:FkbM family methyltransferase
MRGKARFARLLLRSCLQAQDVQIHARYNCTFVIPSLREPIGFHLLIDGVYEVEAVEFVLGRLRTGSVFVDIGANIGVFTLPAAAKIGPTGCVLAIEPAPRIFPYLNRNVTLNRLSNVRLRQCAAFNRAEPKLPFWEAPIEHFGMGALAAQFHACPIAVSSQPLDRILIDESIGRVDVLKVDVEGCERAVFQGAEQLLTRDDAPVILFEFCDWAEARMPGGEVGDAQRLLLGYGYEIYRLSDFVRRQKNPLKDVIVRGFEMLVGVKL